MCTFCDLELSATIENAFNWVFIKLNISIPQYPPSTQEQNLHSIEDIDVQAASLLRTFIDAALAKYAFIKKLELKNGMENLAEMKQYNKLTEEKLQSYNNLIYHFQKPNPAA